MINVALITKNEYLTRDIKKLLENYNINLIISDDEKILSTYFDLVIHYLQPYDPNINDRIIELYKPYRSLIFFNGPLDIPSLGDYVIKERSYYTGIEWQVFPYDLEVIEIRLSHIFSKLPS